MTFFSKYITYILIVIGAIAVIYAQSGKVQNVYVLIGGIFALLIGLMRLSLKIPSKFIKDDEAPKS